MATFTSTMANASSDYLKYLFDKPVKTDRYKDSTLLDFALAGYGSSFVKLTRGAYIKITSTRYPVWYTGYIINEPDLEYLGSKNGQMVFGYKYKATSDEYILNLQSIGIIPPFLNMTAGSIIKQMANRLAPGVFDVTGVKDGPVIAQYAPDPEKKFNDIKADLCDAANFVFSALDHKLYFAAQNDATVPPIVLDATNKHFTPSRLDLKTSAAPIINDVTVVGEIEPQAYVQEYFLGTGLDAAFPLVSSVYGVDTSVLLDEQFSNSSIDTKRWTVDDTVSHNLQVSNGYLNSLGGSANGSYDVRLYTASPIPMEGKLRITHGEFDILPGSGNGFLGSLWTQTPNSSLTGCLFGFKYNSSTGNLNPIAGGAVDTTQAIAIDTSKRYVIRTIVEFTKTFRSKQAYTFLKRDGSVGSISGTGGTDTSVWQTIITEIDPSTGSVARRVSFKNTVVLSGTSDIFAVYAPLVSDNLKATVTGITISTPVAVALELSESAGLTNTGFDDWDSDSLPTGWRSPIGITRDDTNVQYGADMVMTADTSQPSIEQVCNTLIQPNTKYTISCRLQRNPGAITGSVSFKLIGTGVNTGVTVNGTSIAPTAGSTWMTLTGVLTTGLSTVPSDLVFRISGTGLTSGNWVAIDDLSVNTDWASKLVGPNEIDAMDGQAPVATITQPNTGSSTNSSYFGTPQYNPGQAQLVFFKDSVTQTSDIPPANQLIRLSYRSAGPALGRAVDPDSVYTEGLAWGDAGHRAVVRQDLSPRPRTSLECEMAASALVQENSFQHFEGTYTQWSTYFTSEPKAGSVFSITNLSEANVQAEEVTEVVTTFENDSPELFNHVVKFGKPDHIRRLLSKFDSAKGSLQKNASQVTAQPVNISAVGLSFAPDVTKPSLVSWDDTTLTIDTGQNLGATGIAFEARSTDSGWGVDDGKNLLYRGGLRQFTVPRSLRGKTIFIRQVNIGNYLPWSEDQTNPSVYSGTSCVAKIGTNPDGNLSKICTLTYSGAGTFSATLNLTNAWTQFCWSFNIKGAAGTSVVASFGSTNKTVNLTGLWQRVSVPYTLVGGGTTSCTITAATAMSVDVTRYSVEGGTLVETNYAKTTASLYGPTSRYSSLLRVSFPTQYVSGDAVVNADVSITVSSNTTLTRGNILVKVKAISGDITVTLPPFNTVVGTPITVVKIQGPNNVIVQTQGGDTIAGSSSITLTAVDDLIMVQG